MKKNDVTYLSDRAQQCLNGLFEKAYEKTEEYIQALGEVSIYLLTDSNEYDNFLEGYPGVTKEQLVKMTQSNFFELTYYRRENGVKLDNWRQSHLDFIEQEPNQTKVMMDDIYQFAEMINDVLFYFWHVSPIYSYNAVKALQGSRVCEVLYSEVYDLSVLEHALTLQNAEYSDKEFLYYTLIECMSNAVERQVFKDGNYPAPAGYQQLMCNMLKKHNGYNPELPNLHAEVLEEFSSKTGLKDGPDYDKILITEMLTQGLNLKRQIFPPERDESDLYIQIEMLDQNVDSISEFYDNNKEKIIGCLISNWMFYTDEILLSDISMFTSAKETAKKYEKSRFSKTSKE